METTLATSQDVDAPAPIHQALAQRDLLPREHLMDAGYVDADLVVEAKRDYAIDIVGPITKDVGAESTAAAPTCTGSLLSSRPCSAYRPSPAENLARFARKL